MYSSVGIGIGALGSFWIPWIDSMQFFLVFFPFEVYLELSETFRVTIRLVIFFYFISASYILRRFSWVDGELSIF